MLLSASQWAKRATFPTRASCGRLSGAASPWDACCCCCCAPGCCGRPWVGLPPLEGGAGLRLGERRGCDAQARLIHTRSGAGTGGRGTGRARRDVRRPKHQREQYGGERDDVRRVEQREIRHVVIVDDGPREGELLVAERELGLETREGTVRLVDDELGVHLRDQEEFALADLGGVEPDEVGRPESLRFVGEQPDVLRAFFHLAGQVERRRDDHVWVGPADLDLSVEALDVELGRREGLLADVKALGEPIDLCVCQEHRNVSLPGPPGSEGGGPRSHQR